jgi:hypothetical protein
VPPPSAPSSWLISFSKRKTKSYIDNKETRRLDRLPLFLVAGAKNRALSCGPKTWALYRPIRLWSGAVAMVRGVRSASVTARAFLVERAGFAVVAAPRQRQAGQLRASVMHMKWPSFLVVFSSRRFLCPAAGRRRESLPRCRGYAAAAVAEQRVPARAGYPSRMVSEATIDSYLLYPSQL